MPVTLEDVARRAGVSIATVSRVLADKPHVRPALRERVMVAVRELNFRPNRVARTLRAQQSQVIGLIISDIQNPFFTSLVRAVEDVAHEHQYSFLLCNADEDPDKEARYVDLMLAEHAAGVILSPAHEEENACADLVDAGVPVVAIDRRTRNIAVDTVIVDNVSAAQMLIEHLIGHGHRRIGAIIGAPAATTGFERFEGYRRALAAHQLPLLEELLHTGQPTKEFGYTAANLLLDLPSPPTALFAGNNLMTIGALRAIFERGLNIPNDIAVVAFDDMEWMFAMHPALTVAAQPTYDMGQKAAELLLARIADPERAPSEVIFTPTIQIRESCGCQSNHKSL
ncbi:MAG: LacI family DNA-binding transcriptional regulator [Caldilineaceae bacterium]